MGSTLTHGVYLPDEGERNCYNGLAANWSILDGAVGTVAAHTAALAGKAPLVHTHTKSDVTDLFNSANTWSGEQTFSQTIQGNVATASEFANNQSVSLTGTIEGTASSKAGWTIATDFREGRGGRTTTDFYAKLASGSVSGGWNVYVGTFICNASERFETALIQICFVLNNSGVADQLNSVQLRIRSIHGLPKTRFVLVWKNDTNKVLFELYAYNPSANQGILAQLLNEFIRSNNKQSVSIQTHSGVIVNALPDGYTVVNAETALVANDFIPSTNNAFELGIATAKWKTLNGINPGALSLPDVSDGDPISTVGWSLTGARNTYTPTENGWLFIRVKGTASAKCSLNIHSGSYADNYPTWVSVNDPDITLSTSLVVPAQKSVNLYVYIIAAEIEQLIFYPCLGNV